MRTVLFSIGGYEVLSHGVISALAVLLAMGVAYFLAKDSIYEDHISNMVLVALIGAIAGARIWHVFFFDWGYYAEHLLEIPVIWKGGLSIQGGLLGGFAGALVYARRRRISFWRMADLLAPAIILGQGIGRFACFMNGDAYGAPTGLGFGLVYPPGTGAYAAYGSQPLWPAEIFEAHWNIVVFVLLLVMMNRIRPAGYLFLSYNILYSAGRFGLEYFRGDSPDYALGWTAGQWTSVSVIAVCLVLGLWLWRYPAGAPAEQENTLRDPS